ncbi:unnamed protein product [Larinioides sclopetarius]|uniref:ADP-ribosylhydrolase ARH3 n=1 Tax=Larinioides sclopetarius TaxID=280406 RepID=A0AAV2A8I5_9ARAC
MFPYTDDACMTLSVARSLVEKKKITPTDLAKRFVDEYYIKPERGYGMNVIKVFSALKETNFQDVFLPAKMAFAGAGSFGNGAAMRIAPIALFDHNKTDEFLQCLNPFVRSIYFAISIGGDTDTIAAITGSIAGAYYGIDAIPTELQERCEFKDGIDNLAHKLYDVSQKVAS